MRFGTRIGLKQCNAREFEERLGQFFRMFVAVFHNKFRCNIRTDLLRKTNIRRSYNKTVPARETDTQRNCQACVRVGNPVYQLTAEAMTVEEEIEEYQKRTGFKLDAHSRATLRRMIERENRFWDAEPFREDSNNTPVEGI